MEGGGGRLLGDRRAPKQERESTSQQQFQPSSGAADSISGQWVGGGRCYHCAILLPIVVVRHIQLNLF